MTLFEIFVYENKIAWKSNDLEQLTDMSNKGFFYKNQIIEVNRCRTQVEDTIDVVLDKRSMPITYQYVEAIYDMTQTPIVAHHPANNDQLYDILLSLA